MTLRPAPFGVSYPVGQLAALQGDSCDGSSGTSPRSASLSDVEEARPERLRANSYAFHGRGRAPRMDRAHSVPLRDQRGEQLSHQLSLPELVSWQVAEELGHAGGMAAPRYLLVRLGRGSLST